MFLFKIRRKIKSYSKWNRYYNSSDRKIKIPNITIYEKLLEIATENPDLYAYKYFGKRKTYKQFIKQIDNAAESLLALGVKKFDIVTVVMPNTPEAIIAFYAINKIGAVSNMIHPLSSENEIAACLDNTKSEVLIIIDVSYSKVENILHKSSVRHVIGVTPAESMPVYLKIGYKLKMFRKYRKPCKNMFMRWESFKKIKSATNTIKRDAFVKDNPAVILQSGGTTGISKGIVLSNGSFNALCIQARNILKTVKKGDKLLAIMPVFHGFGIGLSVNAALNLGMEVILIPQFDSKKFDSLIDCHKPNIILGVPTLFEALLNSKNVDNFDLSYLKYAICGGDSLSINLELRINQYFADHHAKINITQGFGMTESLAGTIINLVVQEKHGCIGIPLPGNDVKIVEPFTQKEVRDGEDGEICLSGPTLMLGYLNNEEETNMALQIHKDGFLWLHSGDIGHIDKDGAIYYKQRLKRMIISSGYNVYPVQIEEVIEQHDAVLNCTVVGIPHPYKVEVAKACIVLKNNVLDTPLLRMNIKNYCEKKLAKFEQPYKYEFRKSLPKTKMGKIDFKKLQEDEE